jgi:signal transduction histidine kinase
MKGLMADGPGGLHERLGSVAHDVEEEFGVAIRIGVASGSGALTTEIPHAVASAVLRAAREGLVNAAKHAQPCRIDVEAAVGPDETLTVIVRDDGVADLDLDHLGHGLQSVRRMLGDVGGNLRVRRQAGCVTEFEVRVPLLRN